MNPAGNRTQERKKELLSSLALSNFDEETYVSKLENELLAKLPKGELKVLPGLGHTINYTAPKEFVTALRPFLHL